MNLPGFQAKRLLQLAFPVFIAQITHTLMGVIDTLMAGDVSVTDMAAVALGASITLPAMLFVQGLMIIFTPIIARHHGANDSAAIAPLVFQAGYIAIIGSVCVMIFLGFSPHLLNYIDLDPDLQELSSFYIYSILWGTPAFVLYQVFRSCADGISYTVPTMVIGFIGLGVNIPANYIFVYGKLGMPAMGGAGCGVATALVFWIMCLSLGLYVHFHRRFANIKLFSRWHAPKWPTIISMTKLGFPVAMALFFEVSLFAVISLLIAPLGATAIASHQIALNFSSMLFMLPLSIGIAVSIRVGYYLGREQGETSILVTKLGLVIALFLAAFTALITIIFRFDIARFYNDDPEVVALAASLMFLAAVFQLSDAIQVVAAGALRGFKDTRSTFYITLFSYWFFGMTIGYLLAKTNLIVPAMGVHGFWIGLIAGLSCAAVLFGTRLWFIQSSRDNRARFFSNA